MRIYLLLILLSFFGLTGFTRAASDTSFIERIEEERPFFTPELKIYPNPAKTGKVTLELNKGEISEIHLIDITGKKLLTKKPEKASSINVVSLYNIPDGIYFVRVKAKDGKLIIKKLVISNR